MQTPQNLPSDRAIELVAEDKIAAAIRDGMFDDLPGLGKPHPVFDEPYDPHWWIRRKLAAEALGRGFGSAR